MTIRKLKKTPWIAINKAFSNLFDYRKERQKANGFNRGMNAARENLSKQAVENVVQ